ncbi:MAG: ATP-binding cassette domain-containing protein [Alistipes sp.]
MQRRRVRRDRTLRQTPRSAHPAPAGFDRQLRHHRQGAHRQPRLRRRRGPRPRPYTNRIGRMQETDRDIVACLLRLVGMEAFACKTMDRMSDGECQRILIARALAQDTPVILLDEPTAFLDLPNRYELATLLRRLAHDEGKCILFSTHDLDVALGLCDAVALIDTPDLHCLPALRHGLQRPYRAAFRRRRHLVRPRDADDPAHKKVTNSIFFGFFFVRLTFLFTFAPLKLPLQGAAIVVKAHSSIG